MDHYSILDHSPQNGDSFQSHSRSALPQVAEETSGVNPVVTAVPAASTHPEARFPGEDGGASLAAMARRDLDAALQLLADRAQFITGASGAAIALRRKGHTDMLCRASTGSNAPELGSLLSTEFGLSGESVRTRALLRCDDADRDARVNREVCRQLGIASVIVSPIVSDDEVLGVIELFSGKVKAFGERDLSALRRLGEMVETAVKLACAAQQLPATMSHPQLPVADAKAAEPTAEAPVSQPPKGLAMAAAASPQKAAVNPQVLPSATRKPLLWSAAANEGPVAPKALEADPAHVPPAFRNLHKCQACNFPVSEGRKLCVDCEEKQWRGQLRYPAPAPSPTPEAASSSAASVVEKRPVASATIQPAPEVRAAAVPAIEAAIVVPPAPAPVADLTTKSDVESAVIKELFESAASASAAADVRLPESAAAAPDPVESGMEAPTSVGSAAESPSQPVLPATAAITTMPVQAAAEPANELETSLPFVHSTLHKESWLSAHKYMVGAILVIAAVVTFLLLR
jgi:hypothetical protein